MSQKVFGTGFTAETSLKQCSSSFLHYVTFPSDNNRVQQDGRMTRLLVHWEERKQLAERLRK